MRTGGPRARPQDGDDAPDAARPHAAGGVGGTGPAAHGPEDGVVVDARGLRCPIPVIRLARAARDAAPGAVLTVVSTDPAARHDVPAWARLRGHEVVASRTEADGALAITVRVRAPV
ncbi:sulfurtransferase TusA family protein [Cellulomonas sp. NPDC055163]